MASLDINYQSLGPDHLLNGCCSLPGPVYFDKAPAREPVRYIASVSAWSRSVDKPCLSICQHCGHFYLGKPVSVDSYLFPSLPTKTFIESISERVGRTGD